MTIWAIVPAAGIGTRMSSSIPKQYLQVNGQSVLMHSLKALCRVSGVQSIMLALDANDKVAAEQGLISGQTLDGCEINTCLGGANRAQSVLNALHAIAINADADDWVLVHDAARPCVRPDEIDALLTAVEGTTGGLLAVPVRGTLKKANASNHVIETVDRTQMWEAATPQVFRFGQLTTALEFALNNGIAVTDEASAMEAMGIAPQLVPCSSDNLKITYAQDLHLAGLILQARKHEGTYVE